MASVPIRSWQVDGERMETVTDFIFLGSKITADGNCSHEIKRCLLLGREAVTNLDSILKSRDITLQTKVHLVKAMVFPVVKYGCESWTIKKVECQRNWCFWPVVLEKTRESLGLQGDQTGQEISPEYSLEGLMLKLKFQYFGHLMQRTDSLKRPWCWEKLKSGGKGMTEDEMVGFLTDSMDMSLRKLQELAMDRETWPTACSPWGCKESDMTERLNWTEMSTYLIF